ncbi:MAG: DUF1559 domain-containing protein [Gemmataceae bacterium]
MNAMLLLSMALAAPPTELAMVPTDSIAFVHLRGKELWNSELLSGFRKSVESAGPKALAAYDESFYPAPSTLHSGTVFLVPPEGGRGLPAAVGIITFDKSFDVEKVRSVYCEGESKAVPGKAIYPMKQGPLALHFPDDKHIVLGIEPMLEQYLTHKAGPANRAIVNAIEKASAGTKLVACVTSDVIKLMPREAANDLQRVPAEFQALLQAKSVTLTFDPIAGVTNIAVSVQFENDADAVEGEKSVKHAMAMAVDALAKTKPEIEASIFGKPGQKKATPRPLEDLPEMTGALFGLGTINQFEEWLRNPPFVRKGDLLALECSFKNEMTGVIGISAVGVGLLLPAVQKVREAAARMQGANNLKQIMLAHHNFHDAYGYFPSQTGLVVKNGPKDSKKRLSWRVHILPFLDQDGGRLYNQFKLDEPWDSEHNKKLIPLMPKVYMDPQLGAEEGKTYYKGIAGNEAVFAPEKGRKMTSITDGLSNTMMIVAAGKPVIWTAPEDFEFDSTKPLPDFSTPSGRANVAFADGSVQSLNLRNTKPATIKALCTCAGGEVIDISDTEQNNPPARIAPKPVPKN